MATFAACVKPFVGNPRSRSWLDDQRLGGFEQHKRFVGEQFHVADFETLAAVRIGRDRTLTLARNKRLGPVRRA